MRMVHVNLPLDLFEEVADDCKEPDVAMGLSAMLGSAQIVDYMRASLLVFHRLLQGPTRARVMAFANLDDKRTQRSIAHLAFRYGAPFDKDVPPWTVPTAEAVAQAQTEEANHATLYRQGAGIEATPEDEAPLEERDPWNQL
jgi:hypothetical protein